jgi:predicted RNase H-like HicB family nuclease
LPQNTQDEHISDAAAGRCSRELDVSDMKEYSGSPMQFEFTAVFEKVPEGYIAFIEELPGANTQGATIEEARENLKEAIQLVLDANRTLTEESLRGKTVIRERISPA